MKIEAHRHTCYDPKACALCLHIDRLTALVSEQRVALDLVSGALMDCLPADCVQPSPVGYGEAIRMMRRRHDAEVESLREAARALVDAVQRDEHISIISRRADDMEAVLGPRAVLEGKP